MSEETKKTAEAPEQEAKETEAAPQEAPETAAAPEQEAEAEPADAKKKDGWFNKKAREMDAVKAKLDAAEKNAAQAKDSCCGWQRSTRTTASAPPARLTRSSTMVCPLP